MAEEKTQIEEIEEQQAEKAAKIEEKKEDKVATSKKGEEAATPQGAPSAEVKEAQKKKPKKERIGVLNIYTTFNNTIINMTDLAGNTVSKFSGGQSTKQDRLKANPTVAMFIAQKVAEEAKDNGFTGFYVKIRAKTGQANPGPGAHSALKSLTRAGFKILNIMDSTRIPRGGPKKKGGRRGRRV